MPEYPPVDAGLPRYVLQRPVHRRVAADLRELLHVPVCRYYLQRLPVEEVLERHVQPAPRLLLLQGEDVVPYVLCPEADEVGEPEARVAAEQERVPYVLLPLIGELDASDPLDLLSAQVALPCRHVAYGYELERVVGDEVPLQCLVDDAPEQLQSSLYGVLREPLLP